MIVGVDGDRRFVQDGASLVEADQAFLGVHLAVELEHALSELRVRDDAAVGAERERAREARLDVDVAAVDIAQQCADHCRLVVGATQVVIEDVRDDSGVNRAR